MTKRRLFAQQELDLTSDIVEANNGTSTKRIRLDPSKITIQDPIEIDIDTPLLLYNGVPFAPFTLSVGPLGSVPNNAGLAVTGSTLIGEPADGTHPGFLTDVAQVIGGTKTFSTIVSPTIQTSTISSATTLSLNSPQVFINGNLQVPLSIGTFGTSPNPQGLTLASNVLNAQPANASNPGMVSTIAQSFGGIKTFTQIDAPIISDATEIDINAPIVKINGNTIVPLTVGAFSGTSTPNVADITSNVLTIHAADAANPGSVSTNSQQFTGTKTFLGGIVAPTVTNAGTLTLTSTTININGILDAQNITDASGITITSPTVTINGTVFNPLSLAVVGSTPNANGASVSAFQITLEPADNTHPGVLTSGTQTIGGNKTFTGTTDIPVITDATSITLTAPTVTINGTAIAPLTVTAPSGVSNSHGATASGYALTLTPADATNPGLLTATTQTIAGNKTFSGTTTIASTVIAPLTVTAVGGASSANGATASAYALTLTPADATNPGLLTATTQTIAGNKTFSGTTTIASTVIAPLTVTAVGGASSANGATSSAYALTLTPADATNPGLLTATTQTIAGNKTFSGTTTIASTVIAPLTVTAVGGSSSANGATASAYALTLTPADATNPGLLTAGTQTIAGSKTFGSGVIFSNISNTYPVAQAFSNGIQLATTGGSIGLFNYYESNTATITYTCGTTSTGALTVILERIGNIVTTRIPAASGAFTSAATFTSGASLPARFRPVQTWIAPCYVLNGSLGVLGSFELGNAGNAIISVGYNANFTSANIGWLSPIIVTYPVI
jgi:hypothetical protein